MKDAKNTRKKCFDEARDFFKKCKTTEAEIIDETLPVGIGTNAVITTPTQVKRI